MLRLLTLSLTHTVYMCAEVKTGQLEGHIADCRFVTVREVGAILRSRYGADVKITDAFICV